MLGSYERSWGLTRITYLELAEHHDLDHRGRHGTAHPYTLLAIKKHMNKYLKDEG
jgi:hypothetical protein